RCVGAVESTIAVKSSTKAFLVDGWAAGDADNGALKWVLVVNNRGVVIGAGKSGLPSHDLFKRLNASQSGTFPLADISNARFSVAASNDDAQQFSLWGIQQNGARCEITLNQPRHDRLCEKDCGLGQAWYGIGLPS